MVFFKPEHVELFGGGKGPGEGDGARRRGGERAVFLGVDEEFVENEAQGHGLSGADDVGRALKLYLRRRGESMIGL